MNLGQLVSQFKANLNRDDCTDEQAKGFIQGALARLARKARYPFQQRQVTLTANASGNVEVPSDLLEVVVLYPYGKLPAEDRFQWVPPHLLGDGRWAAPTYTIVGDQMSFHPAIPEGTQVVLVYYADFPAVTNDTDACAIMFVAPDVVTLAALADAAVVFVDDRQEGFEAFFNRRFAEIEEQASSLAMSSLPYIS